MKKKYKDKNRYLNHIGGSLIIYVLNAMNTVTLNYISRMQVILIIKTMKLNSRFVLAWYVHKDF